MLKQMGINIKAVLRAAAYGAVLFAAYVMQGMIFPNFPIFGAKPLIIPVLVMCAALFEGEIKAGIIGLFAGILCDFTMNQTVLQFTLFMTILGLGAGYLFETVLSTGYRAFMMCTAIALFICGIIQAFPLMLYYGAAAGSVLRTVLVQTIYSMLFAPLAYPIMKAVSKIGTDK